MARIRETQVLQFAMICAFALFAFVSPAHADSGITYQGRILKPNGDALEGSNVQFRIQIRTPDNAKCLMFEEVQQLDMRDSKGLFGLTIGKGTRSDASGYGMDAIFANRGTFTFDPTTCATGSSYAPNPDDGRDMVVYFKDETMAAWEPMPTTEINYVPFAFESKQIAGFTANSLMRVADGATLGNVSPLSTANYNSLLALIAGTSSAYQQYGKLQGLALPSMSNGQSLGWNGGAWVGLDPGAGLPTFAKTALPTCAAGEFLRDNGSGVLVCATPSNSGGTVTAITAGAGLSGGTITTTGTIALPVLGAGGTAVKVTYDTFGRITAASSLSEADIPTLVTAGKVSGSAITSGQIGGTTSINTSGDIVTTGSITAGSVTAANVTGTTLDTQAIRVFETTNNFKVTIVSPSTLAADYTMTLPGTAGAPGQVLTTTAGGTLAWSNTAVTGITSLTGDVTATGTGAVAASLSTTGVIAGTYGSATQVPTFTVDSKGRLTAAGSVTISGVAPGGAAGGDLSGTYPNPTVAKIQGQNVNAGTLGPADAGKAFVWQGTEYQSQWFGIQNLKTTTGAAQFVDASCAANQTLTWSALTDQFTCTNIAGLDASTITTGTLSAAVLPIVPVSKGGTNSPTALNNNRFVVSSGGAIIEAPALLDGQIFIGQTGGAPLPATLTAGAGISISNGAGSITISASGAGAALNSGKILIGSVANVATEVTPSGDATVSHTGNVVITANAVTTTKIVNDAITTAKIADDQVTFSKLQNINTNRMLGRSTAASGDIEEIALGAGLSLSNGTLAASGSGTSLADGKILIGDASNIAQQVAVTGEVSISNTGVTTISNGAVTNAKIAANAITTSNVQDDQITFAKFQNINTNRILGRSTASAGDMEEIQLGTGLVLSNGTLATSAVMSVTGSTLSSARIWVGDSADTAQPTLMSGDVTMSNTGVVTISVGTVTTAKLADSAVTALKLAVDAVTTTKIADDNVTFAKLQNINTNRMLGRSTASSGDIEEIVLGAGLSLANGTLAASGSGTGLTNSYILVGDAANLAQQVLMSGDVTINNAGVATITTDAVATSNIANLAVTSGKIADQAVTFAKIQNINTNVILGRSTSGAGSTEEITLGSGLVLSGGSLSATVAAVTGSTLTNARIWVGDAANTAQPVLVSGDATMSNAGAFTITANAVTTAKIADDQVTFAKFQNVNTNRLLGRSTASAGDMEEIQIGGGMSLSAGTLGLVVGGGLAVTNGTLSATGGGGDFYKDGSVSMTGAFKSVSGSSTSPGMAFSYDTDTGMFNSGADTLAFSTGGQQRVTIDSNGQVGIGTAVPDANLHVVGIAGIQSDESGATPNQLYVIGATDENQQMLMGYNTTLDYSSIQSIKQGASAMPLNLNPIGGNVGIGTTSPTNRLDVFGGAIAAGSIGSGTGNAGQVRFYDLGASGNNYVAFRAADQISSNMIWTLPAQDGGANQVMVTNGAGSLGWASGLTNTLNAGNMLIGNNSNVATAVVMTGDATISFGGTLTIQDNAITTAKINDGAVTLTKLQNISAFRIIGRATGGPPGVAEEIPLGAGLAISSGTLVSTALGAVTGSTLTNARIWVGDSANTAQPVLVSGDVTMSNAGAVTIATGSVTTAKLATDAVTTIKIADDNVTFAKIQNINTNRLLGRSTAAAGDMEEIQIGGGMSLSSGTLGLVVGGGLAVTNGTLAATGGGGDFYKDGSVSMTGAFKSVSGSSTSPGMAFSYDTDTGMFNSGADTLAFSTGGQQRLVMDSSGNIGIGSQNPISGLDVMSADARWGDTRGNSQIKKFNFLIPSYDTTKNDVALFSAQTKTTSNEMFVGRGYMSGSWNGPTDMYFFTQSAINTPVAVTQRMHLDSVGNLAIGVDNALTGNRLEVQGGAIAAGSIGSGSGNAGQVRFYDLGASGNNYVAFRAPDNVTSDMTWTLPNGDAGGANYALVSNGAGSLSWTSMGAGGDFMKDGSVSMTGALKAVSGSSTSPGMAFSYDTDTGIFNSGANTLAFSTAGQERMTLTANGYVGIGTTNPIYPFDVSANINGTTGLRFTNLSNGTMARSRVFLYNDAGNYGFMNLNSSTYPTDPNVLSIAAPSIAGGHLNFLAGGSEIMRLTTGGAVGIGTTTPLSGNRLEVIGGAIAAGSIGSGTGNGGQVRFYDLASSGLNYVAFRSPDDLAANVTWTLPSADAVGAGYALVSNGAGSLSWSSMGGGGDFMKNGSVSMTGQLRAISGSSLLPGITFGAGSNTGMYLAAAGTLAFSVNGNQRMALDPTGAMTVSQYLYAYGNANAIDMGNSASDPLYLRTSATDIIMRTINSNNFIVQTNNTERMRVNSTGNVGIGTTAPYTGTKVHVTGGAIAAGSIGSGSGSGGQVRFYDLGASGNNYVAFRAPDDISSDVVFTLPGTLAAANSVLMTTATGSLAWGTAGTGNGDFLRDGTLSMTGVFKTVSGSSLSPGVQFSYDADTGMFNPGANTLAFATAGQQRVTVDSSGYMGIGTASPASILHIQGTSPTLTLRNTSNNDARFVIQNGTPTEILSLSSDAGGNSFLSATGYLNLEGTGGSSIIRFNTAGTQRASMDFNGLFNINNGSMAITSSGGLAIGSTSTLPGTRITTYGGAIAAGSIGSGSGNAGQVRFYDLGASGNNYVAFRAPDSIAADMVWTLPSADAGGANYALVSNGAGSLSWASMGGGGDFLRNGSLSMTGQLQAIGGSSLAPGYTFGGDTTTGMYRQGSNGLGFATGGILRMFVNNTGYVGVNDPAPSASLAVMAKDGEFVTATFKGSNWGDSLVSIEDNPSVGGRPILQFAQNGIGSYQQFMNWDNRLWFSSSGNINSPSPVMVLDGSTDAVGIGTSIPQAGTRIYVEQGAIAAGSQSSTLAGEVRFYDLGASGNNFVAFRAPPSIAANLTFILPGTLGAAGSVLMTDATGSLSWGAGGGGGSGDFLRDGSLTMTGQLRAIAGSSLLPGISFGAGSNTGMFYRGANTLAFSTNGQQRMVIDSSGAVGIGTQSPSAVLDVAGLINTSTGVLVGGWGALGRSGSDLEINSTSAAYGVAIYPGSSGAAAIYVKNGTGNVGIGTTTNYTGARLQANGGAIAAGSQSSAGGEVRWYEMGGATGNNFVAFRAPTNLATTTTWTLPNVDGGSGHVLQTNGTGSLTWASVGTGDFMASGSVSMTAQFKSSSGTAAAPGVAFSYDTDTGMYNAGANTLAFATAGTARMLVTSGGSIGIGTTSPAELLDVNGAIRLGTTSNTNAGAMRWDGTNFQGYNGSTWMNFISTADPAACDNTQTFSTAGTFSYVVPASYGTITIKVWGGGGGGGGAHGSIVYNGSSGGNSSIASLSLLATGGSYGTGATSGTGSGGGAGGTASGGTTNTNGSSGENGVAGTRAGNGANSPNGGTGGAGPNGNNPGVAGSAPGAGGSGGSYLGSNAFGGGGGSGAYVEKTYTSATLNPGTNINDIVVGAAGAASSGAIQNSGAGAAGRISITCSSTGAPPMNDGGILFVSGGTYSNTSTFVHDSSGNVGVGTATPATKLQVAGVISNTVSTFSGAFTCGTSTLDFSTSNLQRLSPSGAIAAGTCNVGLTNLVAGSSYTLVVTGNAATNAVTYNFTGYTFKYLPVNDATTAGKDTIYTFLYDGTTVYVTWTGGY